MHHEGQFSDFCSYCKQIIVIKNDIQCCQSVPCMNKYVHDITERCDIYENEWKRLNKDHGDLNNKNTYLHNRMIHSENRSKDHIFNLDKLRKKYDNLYYDHKQLKRKYDDLKDDFSDKLVEINDDLNHLRKKIKDY